MINREKLSKLENIIKEYGQMIIAFSGGVDSTFLLSFAYRVLGADNVAALSAVGPYFAADESAYAQAVCDRLGIAHKKMDVSYILPMIEDNPEDRCYYCKKELFGVLKQRADMVGSVLADGTNFDDLSDFRPGHRALAELGIASPLRDAGLTKAEIRAGLGWIAEDDPLLGAALKLDDGMLIWEKPAFACLASRIPYGEKITVDKLTAIYKAEIYLRGLGFTQLRVRCHDTSKGDAPALLARIEMLPEEMGRILDPELMAKVNEELKDIGFAFVTLDIGGYKMGSFNRENKVEANDRLFLTSIR